MERSQLARKKGDRYPITKTVLRGPWAAAKLDAGGENFRFHDLRHTRGTQIVRETGNLAAAKEALKHSKTTLRYAHVKTATFAMRWMRACPELLPDSEISIAEKARKFRGYSTVGHTGVYEMLYSAGFGRLRLVRFGIRKGKANIAEACGFDYRSWPERNVGASSALLSRLWYYTSAKPSLSDSKAKKGTMCQSQANILLLRPA